MLNNAKTRRAKRMLVVTVRCITLTNVFFSGRKKGRAAGRVVLDGCEHDGESNDAKVEPIPNGVLRHK